MGTFVDELGTVRRSLALDRVHLLGHSWGGMLALEYVLTEPGGVASLVLASSLFSTRVFNEEARRLQAGMPDYARRWPRSLPEGNSSWDMEQIRGG